MRAPGVAWWHFLGGKVTLLELRPGAEAHELVVPAGPETLATPVTADPRWGLLPAALDIEGRLQHVASSFTTIYAPVFPDLGGSQKLEFESAFAKPTLKGQWAEAYGRCFAWQDGAWQRLWETEPLEGLFHPLPLVGDFDGDGGLEVAILPWYELLLLDARTGKVKDGCRFTDGRSYGFFGAYDLDADGLTEFVVQADYAKHVDVLGFRDGRLSLLWRKEIELDFNDPQKILRVGPNPVADTDGDGRLEVLVNLYNDTGDGRWHVLVYDGITGDLKADLPDQHLQAALDIDGDGVAELLTTHTAGRAIPAFGGATVWKATQREPLWHDENAGWETYFPPLPANVNSTATLAAHTVLGRTGPGGFHVVTHRSCSEGIELQVQRWDGATFAPVASLWGPHLTGMALDADGALLARCLGRPGEEAKVRAANGQILPLGRFQEPGPVAPVVVAGGRGGEPLVLAQVAGEELVALSLGPDAAPVERWRVAGRSEGTNWPHQLYGPVIADLAGDGERQLLYATAAPSGCARLTCQDLLGETRWTHDFSDLPGSGPVWNTGGVILWQAGHFTDRRRQDILVTVRRSLMHSEETLLLDGQDGQELWRRRRQIWNHAANGDRYSRAVGGTPFAIADYDGDGLEDAASLHPSIFYILRGSTGEDILAIEARWPEVPQDLVYFGQPVAGAWLGPKRSDVFFSGGNGSMTGVLRADGSLAWWDALNTGPHGLHAFGDFDGDGRPEALGVGYWDPDGPIDPVRCYDCATGAVKWSLPAPIEGYPAGCASGDLDGDGCDEAVFAIGTAVVCFGTVPGRDSGVVRWIVDLPAAVSAPAIADVDGSGQPAVLVTAADGYLYGIK